MIETLLLMDPTTVAAFLLAGIVLNLTPGADVMFATACGLSGGWRGGVAAAFGVALGSVVHVALATVGISAAILAVPHAYDIIRWAGAIYLLWLAWAAWTAPPPEPDQGRRTYQAAIRKGFVTNLLNPKVALFIMAFLPQFATPEIGPIWHQTLGLGLLFIVTGLVITSGYGAFAGLFGAALGKMQGVMGKVSALVFGGLAARIILE
jgi:threonine/homoserine/homoserine lactone efflux protein